MSQNDGPDKLSPCNKYPNGIFSGGFKPAKHRSVFLQGAPFQGRFMPFVDVQNRIMSAIRNAEPFLVTRFGSTEGKICGQVLLSRSGCLSNDSLRMEAQRNSGIFPTDDATLRRFSIEYIRSYDLADIAAAWNFSGAYELNSEFPAKKLCWLPDLTPFPSQNRKGRLQKGVAFTPWTQGLEGRKVLVVHPFVESIRAQYARKDSIKSVANILPDFELEVVAPPVTFLNYSGTGSYFEELHKMKARLAGKDFDVAIVSAGAYGLPLSAFIKEQGKPVIHMAGAGQLLFGVYGARWKENMDFADVIGENWVAPRKQERPINSEALANVYW